MHRLFKKLEGVLNAPSQRLLVSKDFQHFRPMWSSFLDLPFDLKLQPKIQVSTGQVIGAEVLARPRGEITLGEYLAELNDHGMMQAFSLQLIERTQQVLDHLLVAGVHVPLSINLSAKDLASPAIVRLLKKLAEVPLYANLLEVEVLESSSIENVEELDRTVQGLRRAGIRVVLDDFGTGYANLNILAKVKVDGIKVDQTFIQESLLNPVARNIIHSLVDLTHRLNIDILFEGVETEQQAIMVRLVGGEHAQGYLFSRPLDIEAFVAFARHHHSQQAPSTDAGLTVN